METRSSFTFANFIFAVHSTQSRLAFAAKIDAHARLWVQVQRFADGFFALTGTLPTLSLIKLAIRPIEAIKACTISIGL